MLKFWMHAIGGAELIGLVKGGRWFVFFSMACGEGCGARFQANALGFKSVFMTMFVLSWTILSCCCLL